MSPMINTFTDPRQRMPNTLPDLRTQCPRPNSHTHRQQTFTNLTKPLTQKQVQQLLSDLSVFVKANEPGVLRYHLQRETKGDAPTFVMLETYDPNLSRLVFQSTNLRKMLTRHSQIQGQTGPGRSRRHPAVPGVPEDARRGGADG
jgi:hypothetical protein